MLIGLNIGPFVVESELGSGAMGTVYKATYRKDGKAQVVALKIVSMGLVGNDNAMARFDRESAILKQLRHPNIVSLFATGRWRKTPFIAMEFVDGQTLDHILELRGRLGWEDVVAWGKQLCDALQHAHDKGIIHRDLKPSNLMITRDNQLKLTDFGIAKDTDVTALTGANSTIGTASYMSPEQCRGEKSLSAKSDLYSLGIVFYELVTGKKPFSAETTIEMFLKHVNETPVRPSRLVPDMPIWLDNLIMFLLEKNKDSRPMDAATVAKMLANIEEKAATLQSVGAEVANARKIDRPVGAGPLDETDKELARTLRTGKKKKKKKGPPWYRRTWVSVVGALAVLAGMAAIVYLGTRPESAKTLAATVKGAPTDEAKLAAAIKYLEHYGAKSNAETAEVLDEFRNLKVKQLESQLAKRYRNNIKGADEFDEEAYGAAWKAMGEEQAGRLSEAVKLWERVKARFPTPEPGNLTADDKSKQAVWYWLGEKRARMNAAGVEEKLASLKEQIKNEKISESQKSYEPGDTEGLAIRAVRLDQFGDKPKARRTWERVAEATEKEMDQRVWYVLARGQSPADSPKGKDDEDLAAREKLLDEKLTELEAKAKRANADSEERAARREIRNACRDIIALYDDEPSDAIKALVARAKKLLETTKN